MENEKEKIVAWEKPTIPKINNTTPYSRFDDITCHDLVAGFAKEEGTKRYKKTS